jgi:predicted transposase/invertase (TIGR01784 family)
MFPDKEDCISTHSIRDNKTHENDLMDFSFTFIELPKFSKHDSEKLQGIDEWCDLFKNAQIRKSVNSPNPIMKKAYETLEMSNWTEQEILDYYAYEKIMLDNQAREDQVRDEGRAEGRAEWRTEMAREMLRDNEPIVKIIKYSKLSPEEIEKLKQEL